MSSSLKDTKTQDFAKKNASKNVATRKRNSALTSSDSSGPTMDQPLSLEDIQIQPLDENHTAEKHAHGDPQEITQRSRTTAGWAVCSKEGKRTEERCHEDGVVCSKEDERARRRRLGVVDMSDTVSVKRMNARVLQKKFGTSLTAEMPEVFRKKL